MVEYGRRRFCRTKAQPSTCTAKGGFLQEKPLHRTFPVTPILLLVFLYSNCPAYDVAKSCNCRKTLVASAFVSLDPPLRYRRTLQLHTLHFAKRQAAKSQKKNKPTKDDTKTKKKRIIRQYPSAKSLLEKAREKQKEEKNKQHLTQSECDTLLATCVAQDAWDDVLGVLDVMKTSGVTQVRSTYRACLEACCEMANGASAKEILLAMEEAGFAPGISEYATTIHCLCRNDKKEPGWWKKAVQLQQQVAEQPALGDLPIATYNALLSCLNQEGRWKEAVRILKYMERPYVSAANKTMPSLSSYRSVIESCVHGKQPGLAAQFLKSCVDTSDLTPTTFLFGIVISALSEQQQWRRCLQLLDTMDTLHVKKTLSIYNAILTGCSRAREPIQAKSLLLRMRRVDGIDPDIVSFNCVLSACASTSRWKDALKMLDQAHRQPGVTPDVYTYTNAIRACAKGRQRSRALTLLQVMKDKGLPMDVYCYTAAIEACDWKGALTLLAEMKDVGIEPSEVTYSVAIKACGSGGKWKIALELLDAMRSKGMPINVYVYNAAITAISKAAKQRGRRSTNTTAVALFPEVEKLIERMKAEGVVPDGFTYTTAISCCGQEGRWEEALAIIEKMREGGLRTQPNKVAYTAALTSCGKVGKVDEALRLFDQMQEQGLSADLVAYNSLFAALRVGKRSNEAFAYWNLLLRLWKETGGVPRKPGGMGRPTLQPDIITVTEYVYRYLVRFRISHCVTVP